MSDGGVPQDAAMGGRVADGLPGTSIPTVGIDVPGPSSASDGIAAAGKSLQTGLVAFGDATEEPLDRFYKSYAASRGAQAVTRDPTTGQLQVSFKPDLGAISEAYNDAARTSYTTQMSGDMQAKLQELAAANPADSQGFKVAADAYSKSMIQNAPSEVRPDLMTMAAVETNRYVESIFAAQTKQTTENASQGVQNQFNSARNDAMALARQGQGATPAAQQAMSTAISALDSMARNPLFGYSAADHAKDLSDLTTSVSMEAALGHVLQTGKANGSQAALDEASKVFYDPNLPASMEQRNAYFAESRRQIIEDDAMSRQQQSQARAKFDLGFQDTLAAAKHGDSLGTLPSLATLQQAYGPEAAAKYQELQFAGSQGSTDRVLKLAKPADAVNYVTSLNPANRTTAALAASTPSDQQMTQAIIGQESGGNPNAPTSVTGATGIGQIEPGTFAQYAKPGEDINNPTDNYNVATRIVADLSHKYGGDPARVATAYFSGPQNVAPPGSATPWVKDAADPTGKKVSDYVNEVVGRLGAAGDTQANISGYANQDREYQYAAQQLTARQTALTKDPAQYVLANRPDIFQSMSSQDANVVQNGVSALIQQQRDLGVTAPRIFSGPGASYFVQQFENAPDATHRADWMNKQIDLMGQRLGPYFDQGMKELQAAGLPPEAASLYQVRNTSVGAQARMANAINSMGAMNAKDAASGRAAFFAGAPNDRDISKAVPAAIQDYTASLVGNPDGPQSLQATSQAVNLYAHQLGYEGKDASVAAQQAAKDLIASRYNFPGEGLRVPIGVDDGAAHVGAGVVQQRLNAANLEPYAGAAAGVSTADRQKLSQQILSGQGRWVTRADDKGAFLVWPQSSGYKPALDAHGRMISLSWQQLIDAAHSFPVSPSDVQLSGFEAGAGN